MRSILSVDIMKLLPTLVMTDDQLTDGLDRLRASVADVMTAQ